ncbi:exosortase A [Rheinheimera riviphila]|uniref:Exosortase A n=1 Tax=Rheinheimera riviphila TaxID=1834037 RepID=A0A437QSY5_9GAMM|nr:exosortase A [Rheinheimera riviphila]RVU37615.1 exosortase A [Rheinheimera riviphila]
MQQQQIKFGAWLLLLIAGWTLVFWPTLQNMEQVWRGSDTYMHCYLIPLIALWLCYDQRQLINFSPKPSAWPLLLMLPVLLVWLIGFASDTNALSHFSAVILLQLGLATLLGLALSKQLLFPLFYLIFMVPFGEALNPPLQDITASLSVAMLQWAGVPVFREGLYLATPIGQFEVAVACSGLRFLIASVAIGTLFCYLTYRKWYKHLLFMLSLLAFSILANGFRAFFLIWIAEVSKMEYGFGADHYIYGWLFFGVVMFVMFWLGGRFADAEPTAKPANTHTAATPMKLMPLAGFFGLLTVTFILSQQVQLTIAPEKPAAAALPAGFSAVETSDWQVSFRDGLTRTQGENTDNWQVFSADYGHKQQQGEMITWANWLYSTKQWTVLKQRDISFAEKPYRLVELKNHLGQSRSILFWYQIGQRQTVDTKWAKLYQVLSLLQGDSSVSGVRAISVPISIEQLDLAKLEQLAVQMQAQMQTQMQPQSSPSS